MNEEKQVPFKHYFPRLSVSSYFWIVIFVSMVISSILGYFVSIRIHELPLSTRSVLSSQQGGQVASQLTMSPYNDSDSDYSAISGSFIAETNFYDQFVILVRSIPTSANIPIDSDSRLFENPHIGIQYPYMFSRLNPFESYVVSAYACIINPHTYAWECAKNIKITKCSGKIQGATCVITAEKNIQSPGEVDFFLPKNISLTSSSVIAQK